jgi:membrane fusion protein (multidrug efflux system)
MQRGPFRERALRERELSAMPLEPLRLAPGWTRWTYWLMVGALAAALLALVLVRVPEYASGVAVVRAGGRVEVTATAGGTVSSLAVGPQTRVRKGQLLLTLYSAEEAANLRRLDREVESQLVQRLQAPSDPGIAQNLVALRAERELAQARLAERELRAPADGEVSDIRVVAGQLVQAGQPVLAILERRASRELPSVIALLPGGYLPQLQPGMKLRLEVPGHPYVYRWLVLDSVAGEVIGPAEARRLLGPVAGDAVPLEGALAVVTAPLPSPTFEVAGKSYAYRDGMPSRAEVRVKSERLLFALLPALKSLWGENG